MRKVSDVIRTSLSDNSLFAAAQYPGQRARVGGLLIYAGGKVKRVRRDPLPNRRLM